MAATLETANTARYREALQAGFSESQARFLSSGYVTPHEHTASEIIYDISDGETLEEFGERVSEALAELEEEEVEETAGDESGT